MGQSIANMSLDISLFTTFETPHSFFFMISVAFVVAGLCELAQRKGGGGSVMPSFFKSEDMGIIVSK